MKKSTIYKILVSIFLALIIIAIVVSIIVWRKYDQKNKEISKYLIDDISLSEENMDSELATLIDWGNDYFVSDANKGHIYERVANIYKWKGEILEYYSNLGFAVYYLEKSQDYDRMVNLNLDLANYYLLNNSFDVAEKTISEMEAVTKEHPDDVSDQMKCYLYRLKALSFIINGEIDAASDAIKLSNSFINESESWATSYKAINQVNEAHILFEQNKIDEMKQNLAAIEESGFLTLEVYRNIFDRDLNLQYYMVLSKYYISIGDENNASLMLDELIKVADSANCQPAVFFTLKQIYNDSSTNPEFKEKIIDLLQEEYSTYLLSEVNNYYTLTQSQMDNAKTYIMQINKTKSGVFRRRIAIATIIVIFILFMILVHRFYSAAFKDSLTGISNRRSLDHQLHKLKKKGTEFNFVMIDIDDFKLTNDTFGHSAGDTVLKTIGKYLNESFSNSNLKCFRYGGEEFSIIIFNCSIEGAKVITDAIREGIEKMKWEFAGNVTISAGIANTTSCDDVVLSADEKLYEAKTSGKNKVCAN